MRKKSSEWDNYAMYTCMQQRVNPKQSISDEEITLKSFVIKLIFGIIGGIGIWYLTTSSKAIDSGIIIEPSKYLPLALCAIFIIVGLYGIFEWWKKVLV